MTTRIKGPFDGRKWAFLGAMLAILLSAANLRGGIVVAGPLVNDIRAALTLSASQFSLLTTLPLLCFGLLSICVPSLARRFRAPMLIIAALLVISAGAALRSTSLYSLMLFGTLLLGAGIALLNVLVPGLVKGYFPRQLGLMTGLYSLTLSLSAGVGVYLAVPLRDSFDDWQAPMQLWALLPLLSALLWLPMLRVRSHEPAPGPSGRVTLWRDATAWALTVFMGLQSFFFFAIATWLPNILIDAGVDDQQAGLASSLVSLAGIPANLLIPMVAARMTSQRSLTALVLALGLTGLLGLRLSPASGTLLWASLMGLSASASLSLALTLFVLRSQNSRQATSLSAMAQSIGYLLAATGPVAFGAIHDWMGDWHGALLLLMLLQGLQFSCGWYAGRPGFVLADGADGRRAPKSVGP